MRGPGGGCPASTLAQILQVFHRHGADVEEPVRAVRHAALLGPVQLPALDGARDALLETYVRQGVDGLRGRKERTFVSISDQPGLGR